MGDRTSVTLTFLAVHEAKLEKIAAVGSPNWTQEDKFLLLWHYDEVNYGELSFLEQLRKEGIPYDSHWDSGSEYPAGFESFRITSEGSPRVTKVYNEEVNPSLTKCMELLDNYQALRNYLEEHIQNVTVLPWDDQENYSKIFQAKKLIGIQDT